MNPNPGEDPPFASRSPSEGQHGAVTYQILIVDDNEADIFLIEKAIAATKLPVSFLIARNGEQAIEVFDRADRFNDVVRPAVVILDINLPRKTGYEVLKHMRKSPSCGKTLVIAISTSGSAHDREQMTALGADAYFQKPSAFEAFMKLGDLVQDILARPRNR